jgi:hypothetical protein
MVKINNPQDKAYEILRNFAEKDERIIAIYQGVDPESLEPEIYFQSPKHIYSPKLVSDLCNLEKIVYQKTEFPITTSVFAEKTIKNCAKAILDYRIY